MKSLDICKLRLYSKEINFYGSHEEFRRAGLFVICSKKLGFVLAIIYGNPLVFALLFGAHVLK